MLNQFTIIGKVLSISHSILVLKSDNKTFKINIKDFPKTSINKIAINQMIAISGSREPRANSTLNKLKIKKLYFIGELSNEK